MIIKKGKIIAIENYTDVSRMVYTCTIIEKTEGNYTEILFRKDSKELIDNNVSVSTENEYEFKVYYNATINQILSYSEIYAGSYTWDEELTQIS